MPLMGLSDRDTCQEEGARDLERANVVLQKASRRRAVPRWSLPGEIWLMLLAPNYFIKKKISTA
eukprot:7726300-Pyramimonas_sp.AAC.1